MNTTQINRHQPMELPQQTQTQQTQNNNEIDQNRASVIENFVLITGVSAKVAKEFLEKVNWNFDDAISRFENSARNVQLRLFVVLSFICLVFLFFFFFFFFLILFFFLCLLQNNNPAAAPPPNARQVKINNDVFCIYFFVILFILGKQ
jgi:hypothetical protein